MTIILVCLVAGIIIGQLLSSRYLRVNEKFFTILSTLFVFLMGISLGISRTIFMEAQELIIEVIFITLLALLGSIIFTAVLSKILNHRNV